MSKTDYLSISLLMLIAFTISAFVGLLTKQLFGNPNYAPCWSLYQCFVQKGSDGSSNVCQQILSIIWLLTGFIATAVAGGELVSMLAGQPPKPIATLRELAEATHIKIFLASKPIEAVLKVTE